MQIHWINGRYKEDDMTFDSDWEAQEWADSICSDFVCSGFFGHEAVGYATPDEKVATHLCKLVPQSAEFIRTQDKSLPRLAVKIASEEVNGRVVYKVWIEPLKD